MLKYSQSFLFLIMILIPAIASSEGVECQYYECLEWGGSAYDEYNNLVNKGMGALYEKDAKTANDMFISASKKSLGSEPNIFLYHLIALSEYLSGGEESEVNFWMDKAIFSAELYTGIISCGEDGFIRNETGRDEYPLKQSEAPLNYKELCADSFSDFWGNWNLEYIVHKAKLAERALDVKGCINSEASCWPSKNED